MPLLDHVLVVLILLGVPIYEHFWGIEHMKRRIAEDQPNIRRRLYWQTIGIQWLVAALVLGWWFGYGRSAPDIGFASPTGWRFWLGLGLAAAAAVSLVVVQRLQIQTDARKVEALKEIQRIAPFMPRDGAELTHFVLLSLTAGVCEEIVYRGYFIWYALSFAGTSITGYAAAIVLPALFFGLAHLYQGPRGMMQVFIAGVFFGMVFVLTGSLWAPMLLHAAVDINGGILAVHLKRAVPAGADDAALSSSTPAPGEPDPSSVEEGDLSNA